MARFDVAVFGGGPAGCAAAARLARGGRSVAVFERGRYTSARVGEVVPSEIRVPLEALGAWEDFTADPHLPLAGITSRWGSEIPVQRDALFRPGGGGWILDRRRFDLTLSRAAARAGAVVQTGVRVVACRPLAEGWEIELHTDDGPRRAEAGFIVNATGRSASIRHLTSGRFAFDRLLAAIRHQPNGSDAAEDGRRLHIESTPEGWWYSVRLPSGTLAVVHLTDAEDFAGNRERRARLWEERFRHTRALHGEMPELDASEVRCVPAGTSLSRTLTGPNYLAVGDAALSMDPLSGQGLLRAIEGGVDAAGVLLAPLRERPSRLAVFATSTMERWEETKRLATAYYRSETRWRTKFWMCRA